MEYKVLITLDLKDVTDEQREEFYKELKEFSWSKIEELTTTWECSFKDSFSRSDVSKSVLFHMQKAKQRSKITQVKYAFQMDREEIEVGNL